MSRVPSLGPDQLDERQRALWESVVTSPRASALGDAPATLPGPFNPWMYAPAAGLHAARLGEELRYNGVLDSKLRELAIITVAAHWRAPFEFWAHSRHARKAGLDEAIIAAVRDGRDPEFDNEAEAVIHAVAVQLLHDGTLDDGLYARAVAAVGEGGTVEVVMLIGYYTLVSFTLNAFDVPLPPGVESIWSAGSQT